MTGRAGLRLGRIELVGAAFLIFVLQPVLFVAAPGSPSPASPPPSVIWHLSLVEVVLLGAFVAQLVGFAWMLRIHRSHREPEAHRWRYRAR